mmetsp:Transcript_52829/g.141078  ORF Transcript_52829/g.141078 Transcript_52829/m.141078 type:complete len:285 (+) Transcript_52829:778-1632(+)
MFCVPVAFEGQKMPDGGGPKQDVVVWNLAKVGRQGAAKNLDILVGPASSQLVARMVAKVQNHVILFRGGDQGIPVSLQQLGLQAYVHLQIPDRLVHPVRRNAVDVLQLALHRSRPLPGKAVAHQKNSDGIGFRKEGFGHATRTRPSCGSPGPCRIPPRIPTPTDRRPSGCRGCCARHSSASNRWCTSWRRHRGSFPAAPDPGTVDALGTEQSVASVGRPRIRRHKSEIRIRGPPCEIPDPTQNRGDSAVASGRRTCCCIRPRCANHSRQCWCSLRLEFLGPGRS